MPSPFEMAWNILKMPLGNQYDDEPGSELPGATPPSLTPKEVADDMRQRQATKEQERFSNLRPTPIPPELQYKKPSNLVSSTGRLGDVSLEERQEGMMKPVPPPMPPQ
jgi:hypothetical protein